MRYGLLIISLLVGLLVGCSGNGSFKVTGTLSDGANTNLYIKYYSNGAVHSGVIAATDGKFELVGSASEPTIVEILDRGNKVLGRVYAVNGDELTIVIDMKSPLKSQVRGTPENERWGSTIYNNAMTLGHSEPAKVNEFVERYIDEHPDDVASTLLFVTFYDASLDPVHADEVFCRITEEARIPSIVSAYMLMSQPFNRPEAMEPVTELHYRTFDMDSATFTPRGHAATLLSFRDDKDPRNDSIVRSYKQLRRDYAEAKLQIVDFALYPDTTSWKGAVRGDSAKWVQAWTPGGILSTELDRLAIPAIPYYIVLDSAGVQQYRGADPLAVSTKIKSLIKK